MSLLLISFWLTFPRIGPFYICSWFVSAWSACSTTCGQGKQVRRVHCQRAVEGGETAIISDDLCSDPKPITMRACHMEKNCPKWSMGQWSSVCTCSCLSWKKKRFLKWFRLSKGKLASEAEPITVPGELNIDRLSMRKVEGTVQEFFNLPEANNSFNLNFQKRRFYSFLCFHLLTNHKTERGSLARRSHALFLDCTWQAQKLYIAR